ncbi:hypothetical protein HYC85_017973 [Camellia sinensis]|uniref:CASP-like protein n=1 Tax=Camellia sinensis TaxID=4442 RepID=A0A7J7GWL6_CAMSI|nr:hypothetical protein HYC85_017973 [Camellia sinensis]
MVKGTLLFNKSLAWAIFSCDQVYPTSSSTMIHLTKNITTNSTNALKNFLFDSNMSSICINSLLQLMAYLTLAAVAAAAQSSVFAKFGESELQWMKICNMYGKFCNQVGERLASAVIASLSMVVLSGVSAFSLFRLYDGDKGGKSSARW